MTDYNQWMSGKVDLKAKKERPNGIGGTDAQKLVEGNWIDLYDLKIGKTQPDDLSNVLPVQMGTATENLNRAWFEKEMKLLVTPERLAWYNTYIYGLIDGYVLANTEIDKATIPIAVFEAKHSGQFMDTPKQHANLIDRYYPQVQHYMLCSKLPTAYLSIFFGNRTHKIFTIKQDRDFQSKLLKVYKIFWKAVMSKTPETIDTNWKEFYDEPKSDEKNIAVS